MLIRALLICEGSHVRRLVAVVAAAAVILIAGVATARGGPDDLAGSAKARAAVARGLPFLETEGVAWMNDKKCVSCHQVPFLIWSHSAARAAGVAVDVKKLAEWTDWSWKFSRTRREWFKLTAASLSSSEAGDALPTDVVAKLQPVVDKPFATEQELLGELERALTREELDRHRAALVKRATRPCEPTNDGGGLDTLSQLLLGRSRDIGDPKAGAEFVADLAGLMVRWQQPDGSWKAAGQLPSQNRPHAETDAVTTRWAILALAAVDPPAAATDRAVERASAFLKTVKPGETNESLIATLLVERKLGHAGSADELLGELRRRQNPDGGWAWRPGGDSDAFATGQSLFALAGSKVSSDDAAVRRARDYLIGSQTPDGSWPLAARGISSATNEARLKKLAPIYRYWGTAWAVIGLSLTL